MTFLENASPQVYILPFFYFVRTRLATAEKYFVVLPSPTPAGLATGRALYICVMALRTPFIGLLLLVVMLCICGTEFSHTRVNCIMTQFITFEMVT